MIYVGIDPGLNGGVAAIDDDGSLASVQPIPTLSQKVGKHERNVYDLPGCAKILQAVARETMVTLEVSQPMPSVMGRGGRRRKMPAASAFSQGQGIMLWRAMCAALDITILCISPQKWKGEMLAGSSHDKGAALVVANGFWPGGHFGKRKDAGLAEAALIAEYGRRVLRGGMQRGQHG